MTRTHRPIGPDSAVPTRDLEARLRQAQKMEVAGRLTCGLGHDLNNLLTIISGFAHLLVGQLPADHSGRPLLDQIIESSQRASSLIEQMQRFSRDQPPQPQTFDLNGRVGSLGRMFALLFAPRKIQVVQQLAPDAGSVRADPGQFDQVVMNLVVNARDAMPNGGRLTLVTDSVQVPGRSTPDRPLAPGRYCRLTVTDTGAGMDEATRTRIFERYFTTKESGTGLGLAIVNDIVREGGGQLTVASTPGQGTTFTVYLPRADTG